MGHQKNRFWPREGEVGEWHSSAAMFTGRLQAVHAERES